jgi:hypothetical protein
VPDHVTIHGPATTVATMRQPARKGLFALAAACVLALGPRGEAAAQTEAEPAAMIAAIYKQYQGKGDPKIPDSVHSARLQKLMAADRKRTPKGEVGRLEFDPFVNGQDWEIKKLVVRETERKGDRATVRATFDNLGEPQDIEFQLVRRQQRWLLPSHVGLGHWPDHLITSSARASSDGGISRPAHLNRCCVACE